LLVRADRGEPEAVAALAQLVPPMGAGIATLLALFNSVRIILDGLFANVLRCAEPQLQSAIAYHRPTLASHPVDFMPAQLGDSAPLLGAAEGAIAAFLSQLDPYVERVRVADSVRSLAWIAPTGNGKGQERTGNGSGDRTA
jgi:predicted NBD/HSP70 family sugar kinase